MADFESEQEQEKKASATRSRAMQPTQQTIQDTPASTSLDQIPPHQHQTLIQRTHAPGHAKQKHAILRQMQSSYGNRYVQRVMAGESSPSSESLSLEKSSGQPLSSPVRHDMENRFGSSLGDVRVHTDSAAADASRQLNARAFTTGQDIYFSRGAYQPETPDGRVLLAHELTHTVQQQHAIPGVQKQMEIVSPNDPMEQQADEVAQRVVRGQPAPAIQRLSRPAFAGRVIQRQGEGEAAAPAAAAAAGPADGGDFVVDLAGGFRIARSLIDKHRRGSQVTKQYKDSRLPGLQLRQLTLTVDRNTGDIKSGSLSADVTVPHVKMLRRGGVRFSIDKHGKTSMEAGAKLDIPALNNAEISLKSDKGELSAEAQLSAAQLKNRHLPRLKIPSSNVVVGISKGKLYGSGDVSLEYAGLAKGNVHVAFKDGQPQGKGDVAFTASYLKGVHAGLAIKEKVLTGELSIPAAKLKPPIPGLQVTGGTLTVGMKNQVLSGKGEAIALQYKSLGDVLLDFNINKDVIAGGGTINVHIPGLQEVTGKLRIKNSKLSGEAKITANKFPKGLPVKQGTITVGLDQDGNMYGHGGVQIQLLSIGKGEFKLGYEKGILDFGAAVELKNIPGLEAGAISIQLKNEKFEGKGEIAIAPKQIPGLRGSVIVEYKEERFSGQGKIAYEKDKFAGNVELFVAQDEKGKLALSGRGEVTARLTDWLTGKVNVEVLPDATTKIAGELKADDIELFPEKKADRELFNVSQNIPLWAILVAVIRLRGGVRAGVGPGMLRGITARGEFSTGEGDEPSFSITGELFIPAYAEAYIAFGAGLGLDVVIGSLTGGIEAVGTAGIYGAVSVIPEIAYRGGEYSISGVATLAAGAKLKLGLQAWAEVEAFWITVWSNEWQLAEWVWDVGPELALQANMNYVFGRPEPPTLDFKTSDIDSKRLIQDALPKHGPKGSGAREALQNRAAWKGKLKEQRKDPSKIPTDLARKQQKAPQPKAPPPKKGKASPPPGMKSKDPNKVKAEANKALKNAGPPDKSKSKPIDKAHQEKVDKALADFNQFVAISKSQPLDEGEVKYGIQQLKAKHAFKQLSYKDEGDTWLISGEINPSPQGKAKRKRRPEGEVGTYTGLQGPVGDHMTPDHQPQHSLMSYVANDLKDPSDNKKKLFESTPVANYNRNAGICMNLGQQRHYKTRSYGRSPPRQEVLDVLDNNKTKSRVVQQTAVAKFVKDEMEADHARLEQIYNGSLGADLLLGLTPDDKKRVLDNRKTVEDENRSAYFSPFW